MTMPIIMIWETMMVTVIQIMTRMRMVRSRVNPVLHWWKINPSVVSWAINCTTLCPSLITILATFTVNKIMIFKTTIINIITIVINIITIITTS